MCPTSNNQPAIKMGKFGVQLDLKGHADTRSFKCQTGASQHLPCAAAVPVRLFGEVAVDTAAKSPTRCHAYIPSMPYWVHGAQ